MNVLIGVNMAYLSFIPNAGNSISVALITVILFFGLSIISLLIRIYKIRIKNDYEDTKLLRNLMVV